MNKRGFTLAEVLTVIVVISLLLTIAIPSINTISNNINKRAFESKKDLILSIASNYGKDHSELFINNNLSITVDTLIDEKYLDVEVADGDQGCNNEGGCILNPVTKEAINNVIILIRKDGDNYISIWDVEGQTSNQTLIDKVKSDLNCSLVTASSPCVYKGNVTNNYLYYSGIMWRIIGVYKIDDTEVVKLITDDTISWEETN